jgi:hypothetical protein
MPVRLNVQGEQIPVWTRADFSACPCGRPDCDANCISLRPPCKQSFDAIITVHEGVLLLICTCGEHHTKAIQIGEVVH